MSVQSVIECKLAEAFNPVYLEVVNESGAHNVPPGSESHFKVIMVSAEFAGKRLIQRHRAINMLLADELKQDVHALALHTYTPEEWQNRGGSAPFSPRCAGGGH